MHCNKPAAEKIRRWWAVFSRYLAGGDNRGMALLITIVTIVLLVAVTLQFSRKTWAGYRASYAVQVGGKLEAIVSSGLNLAVAALRPEVDDNAFDSLLDPWAVLGADEALATMFPEGSLELQVTDLSGLLAINNLVQSAGGTGAEAAGSGSEEGEGEEKPAATEKDGPSPELLTAIFSRLLLSGDFAVEDEGQVRELVDALKDWIDADDEESEYGAESGYYSSAGLAYGCRNAPLRSVEELLLIRGFTPELLFGTAEKKALADFITVSGDDGRININTAPKEILVSLDPLITEELADRLMEFRSDEENKEQLAAPTWYQNMGGWPADIVLDAKLLTVKSSFFMVRATGVRDSFQKKLVAVVERSDNGQFHLIWKKQE